jgi:hypothetical protein
LRPDAVRAAHRGASQNSAVDRAALGRTVYVSLSA